jgi:hypothetical protein
MFGKNNVSHRLVNPQYIYFITGFSSLVCIQLSSLLPLTTLFIFPLYKLSYRHIAKLTNSAVILFKDSIAVHFQQHLLPLIHNQLMLRTTTSFPAAANLLFFKETIEPPTR